MFVLRANHMEYSYNPGLQFSLIFSCVLHHCSSQLPPQDFALARPHLLALTHTKLQITHGTAVCIKRHFHGKHILKERLNH